MEKQKGGETETQVIFLEGMYFEILTNYIKFVI